MKSIYLAGKLNSNELTIDDFASELETRGHEVLEKWWLAGKLPTPYLDHPATSSKAAKAMITAAYNSEITILFPGERILGAAVELGAALAAATTNLEKLVIIVNPFETRQSVFYAHPSVINVAGLTEIRQHEWY